jgi:ubiquinone/menaquinone biosynthesis C-methylase UbiE
VKIEKGETIMKSEEDTYKKTIELYEKLGKKYLEDIAGVVIRELPNFMRALPKGGKVLDVGCAGGRDSKKLVEAGFEVTGIDLVNVFLEEAEKNVPQAKFIRMDLLNLEFPDNYFDGI